jgi:pSer/pThr/pTyr-binding forkhead associated (FHA) protein
MNLLRKARDLEARLAGTLDRTVGEFVRSGAREPVETIHAIVEAVQGEIQSGGRGRRIFPFNTIAVTILAPSRDARARLEAMVDGEPSLRDRIVASLAAASCQVSDLDVSIEYDSRTRKHWRAPEFHIEFERIARTQKPAAAPAVSVPRVELTVLQGTAERRTYSLPSARIDIGRCADVRDSRHRLIRTNHVAFLEGSNGANQTVSRRHAHISYEPDTKSLRLHDDGSEHGTGVVRHGRTVAVPRGVRGVRLESGDEIVLGDARVRVRFGQGARSPRDWRINRASERVDRRRS